MKIIKLLTPVIAAFVAFMVFVAPLDVFAASGTLYINPGEGRYDPGSTFSVEVRANTGNASRQVTRATLTYPTSILQAVESNSFGSDFSNSNTSVSHSTGRVTYTAYDSTPPNGTNLFVYRITFKVIGQGDATLQFANDVAVNGSPVKGQNAQYRLYPAQCPAGQTGTPPNCNAVPPAAQNPSTPPKQNNPSRPPATSTQPSKRPAPSSPSTSLPSAPLPPIPLPPMPELEKPVVSTESVELPPAEEATLGIGNIRTAALYDTTTIYWESNRPSTSTFQYGTSADTLDKRADVTQDAPTKFRVTLSDLKPGEKYFYEVVATEEADASKTDSHKSTFTTKGYPITITVIYNDEPLPDATLSLKNFSGNTITDDEGSATLELKEGTYDVVIKKDGVSFEETIAVRALDFPAGKVPDTQIFSIQGSGSALSSGGGAVAAVVIGVVLLLGIIAAIVIVVRKKRSAATASGYQPVVIDDWTPPTSTTYVNPTTGSFNVPPPPSYPQAPRDDAVPENEYFADLGKR